MFLVITGVGTVKWGNAGPEILSLQIRLLRSSVLFLDLHPTQDDRDLSIYTNTYTYICLYGIPGISTVKGISGALHQVFKYYNQVRKTNKGRKEGWSQKEQRKYLQEHNPLV